MFADPVKILKQLDLREHMIVADLGAGTGFYSIGAGHIVTSGKVYAIEVNKDYLTTIANKIKETHLKNVDIILGDIEKRGGTKLGENVVDAVIASNVLFQVENKQGFINEIKRVLKAKGKVLLVDHDSDVLSGRDKSRFVSKEKALSIFVEQGFVLERYIDAGDHHYGMILSKL